MIKIQDIINFIGSKRPKYEMENWGNFKKFKNYPTKNENGELGFYNDKNLKEGLWSNRREFFKTNFFFKNGEIVKSEKKNGFEIYYDDKEIPYYLIHEYFFKPFIDKSGNELGYFNDNGKLEGIWEGYWEDGSLHSKGNFKNNLKDGYWEDYWRGGQVGTRGNFENGIKVGEWVVYPTNSKLYSKGTYVNNKREGEWKEYYISNDKLYSKGTYVNDKREGEWVYYYGNGKIRSKGKYVNNKEKGKWDYFDENGNYRYSEKKR